LALESAAQQQSHDLDADIDNQEFEEIDCGGAVGIEMPNTGNHGLDPQPTGFPVLKGIAMSTSPTMSFAQVYVQNKQTNVHT
jgi:hypothetical protein